MTVSIGGLFLCGFKFVRESSDRAVRHGVPLSWGPAAHRPCKTCIIRSSRCNVELTIGIYIVGSLYWEMDKCRSDWRGSRLDMECQFLVRAPIRYGRLAASRGNTYTMVFSQSAGPGQAIVVRCKRPVSTAADLVAEAQHLWAAEMKVACPTGALSAGWGSVGLLANEKNTVPTELLASWAQRVSREPNYAHVSHTPDEGPVIERRGRLLVPWPDLVDGGATVFARSRMTP